MYPVCWILWSRIFWLDFDCNYNLFSDLLLFWVLNDMNTMDFPIKNVLKKMKQTFDIRELTDKRSIGDKMHNWAFKIGDWGLGIGDWRMGIAIYFLFETLYI